MTTEDEARYTMIQDLAVALHGHEMPARTLSPVEVWNELLAEVRDLTASPLSLENQKRE